MKEFLNRLCFFTSILFILCACKPYDSKESDKLATKPLPGNYTEQPSELETLKPGSGETLTQEEISCGEEEINQTEFTPGAMPDTADLLSQPSPDFSLYTPYEPIKGAYITSNIAGIADYFHPIVGIIEETELNSVVIDIKRDDGHIAFKGIPAADELGLSNAYIRDIAGLLDLLHERDIYTIARIVVFRDNFLADVKPEFFARLTDGSIYRDKQTGQAWLDPYNRDYWEYVIAVAEGAAKAGFKEIQFDYIRFPTDANIKRAVFDNPENISKIDIISEFSEYAVSRLKKLNVKVSADVYGISIISGLDAEAIGQDYVKLSKIFDVICPMIYPSHYAGSTLGVTTPDLAPYDIIYRTMELSTKKLSEEKANGEKVAIVRPWIQAFTASYLGKENVNWQRYKGKQLREQFDALYDAGVSEWLIWNASNNYTEVLDGLLPENQAEEVAQAGGLD